MSWQPRADVVNELAEQHRIAQAAAGGEVRHLTVPGLACAAPQNLLLAGRFENRRRRNNQKIQKFAS